MLGPGIESDLVELLKTVVQTNSDALQGTHALMLAVLQNQNNRRDMTFEGDDKNDEELEDEEIDDEEGK